MKKAFALALALVFTLGLKAQTDPVVIEVGDQKIHQSEFMKEFRKSIGQDPKAAPTACTYEKRQALEEYVELYTNYRTKLYAAKQMGLDTHFAVRYELHQYRKELCLPYLIDSASMEHILREAYERNHYVLHASHILLRLPAGATPADTLAVYKRAMEVYEKAAAGADFGKLAMEYSDDPSAKADSLRRRGGNKGDLGNFTVFQMVYPFECAAYSLEPGEVSKPVRTNYGYHIIKLHDRINYFGKSTIQHIWIDNSRANGAKEIQDAYRQLREGQGFGQVAYNYSSDRQENGGFAANIDVNQMPAEYVEALSKLREGEFSAPFQTSRGWHIVRLVKRDQMPPYADMVPLYKQRLTNDQRSKGPKEAFLNQCKRQYNFVDHTQVVVPVKGKKKGKPQYEASLAECVAAMTDSVYRKKWQYEEGMITDLRPLFTLNQRDYTAVDFLRWLQANQKYERRSGNYDLYLNERYKEYVDGVVFHLADSLLEQDNADFRALMQEYRNGLMLFSYNDKFVWSQAIKDTAGMEAFYARESALKSIDNPEDAQYFWGPRAHIISVEVADSALLSPKKAKAIIAKALKKGLDASQMEALLLKAAKASKDTTITEPLTVTTALIEEGTSNIISRGEWRLGVYDRMYRKGYGLAVVDRLYDPQLKSLREARGYYVSDYQNYVDAELIKSLREKYNVKVHQNVVDEITY